MGDKTWLQCPSGCNWL